MGRLLIAATLCAAVVAPSAALAQEPSPPGAAFIGDSIGYFALDEITREVTRSRPLPLAAALQGTTIRNALPLVREQVARPDAPPIWVIGLGHVDASLHFSPARMQRDIRSMLEAVAPHVDCVRWLDITEQRGFYPGLNALAGTFNHLLRSASRGHDNVEVMPYSAWAALAPPGDFLADNVHHTAHGERELGRLVRQAADGCDPMTNSGPFWDVPNTDPAAGAIAWTGDRHLVRAYSDRTYRARLGSIAVRATRGTLAYAAWRRAGEPRGYPPSRFDDIPVWLRPALAWLDHEGLATGSGRDRYRPGAVATRAWSIDLLWRVAGAPRPEDRQPWVDAPGDLRPALRWLVSTGLRSVFPGTEIVPTRALTRAQLAQLLAPPAVAPPGPTSPPHVDPAPTEVVVRDEADGSGRSS